MFLTRKRLLALGAALCYTAVAAALVSQHVFDMVPCAWCVFQRLIYLVLGTICLIGLLGPARIAAGVGAVLAVLGIWAAWFQYTVAAHLVSCDQTFADRFMVKSGLDGTFPSVFGIFATCMDAQIELLGIEYALWSLGLFVILFGMMLIAALRKVSAVASPRAR